MGLPETRAGLFTAYWTKTDGGRGKEKSDLYQAIQVVAAGEMLRKRLIDKAVFVAGRIYPLNQAVSFVMAGELKDQFPELKDNQIVVDPMAFDTKGELQKFYSRAAVVKGMRPSVIVGVEPHTYRIGLVNKRIDRRGQSPAVVRGSVAFLTSDQELRRKHAGLLDEFFKSAQTSSLIKQEKVLYQVERAGCGPVLDWIAENLPGKPAIQVAVLRLTGS